jgi:hypothetical protein
MRDDLAQMRALLDRLQSTANNLDFTLKIAEGRATLGGEMIEDINFDVDDIMMFSRAVSDAWRKNYG